MVDFKREMDMQKSVSDYCTRQMANPNVAKKYYKGKPKQFDTHKMTNDYINAQMTGTLAIDVEKALQLAKPVLRMVCYWYNTYNDKIGKHDLFD
jgi:hypothetical protein